jgi:hypothetical protein
MVAPAPARACLAGEVDAGRVATVPGYAGVLVRWLLHLPLLAGKLARLRDTARRARGG